MRIGGEAPRGGPILNRGAKTMSNIGLPPLGPSSAVWASTGELTAATPSRLPTGKSSRRRTKQQTFWRFAGGREPPQCNEELARERDDHGLARAVTGVRGSHPIPSASGLSF